MPLGSFGLSLFRLLPVLEPRKREANVPARLFEAVTVLRLAANGWGKVPEVL